VLLQGEWIRGLALRRPLDRRLAQVEQHLVQSRAVWELIKKRSIIWGAVTVILSLISGLILLRRQRRRILKKLKHRIARDLHDEVGSNLGSISFTAEHLQQAVKDPEILPEILDLSLISREACASLREVVWVTDESVIRLPALLQKLVERAERVLHGMALEVEVASDCPDIIVSLTCKRHLLMFFKEVIHNCARHSEATKVALKFSTGDKLLHLSVRDNGCGFDPAFESGGWGLGSMKERTAEIGGELTIESEPGKGTYIEFCAPLSILSKDLGDAYTTSN
jgi:signal transduction histidine kinase